MNGQNSNLSENEGHGRAKTTERKLNLMKNRESILQQYSWHLAPLRFPQLRKRLSRHRMEDIPNFNTAEGQKALFSLTTGICRTQQLVGFRFLATPDGSFNTAIGAGTLLLNVETEVQAKESATGCWHGGAF